MRMSRKDRNEFTTIVYDTLRAYQDGKLKEGCVSSGLLDIPLTNVMDRITRWVWRECEPAAKRQIAKSKP